MTKAVAATIYHIKIYVRKMRPVAYTHDRVMRQWKCRRWLEDAAAHDGRAVNG